MPDILKLSNIIIDGRKPAPGLYKSLDLPVLTIVVLLLVDK